MQVACLFRCRARRCRVIILGYICAGANGIILNRSGDLAAMTTDSLALDFKSATLYAVRVVLHSADLTDLTAALNKRMHDAGSFFENEPVVIDATKVAQAIDWVALMAALQAHKLPPIGAVASPENAAGAKAAGLAHVELSTPSSRPAQNNAAVTTEALDAPVPSQPASRLSTANVDAGPGAGTETGQENSGNGLNRAGAGGTTGAPPASRPPQSASALVITKPLRSGQRVYARHTDLIVIGMVSQGAEVIADGNIHVYGPLRGKAMAGARGDTSARIFTTELDAELLAVAGVYRVVEARLDDSLRNRPALIRLEGDALHIENLKT